MPEFVHLHNHTHYSLLDGACSVDGLIEAAVEQKMPAVGLTDHGVNFGLLEFYQKAKKAGVKPIVGCEVYVADGDRFDKSSLKENGGQRRRNYFHLILLAKNYQGYKTLNKLTSRAHTEGFYYKPRIDRTILEEHHEGLVCLSACAGGVVSAHLVNNDMDRAREAAIWYRELFGEDFYLEIQNHGIPVDGPVLEGMPMLAKELQIPLIATNDCHYIRKEHAVAHNVLLHIRDASKNGVDINIEEELRYGTDNYYFKSAEEMATLFKEYPEAIERSLEVAEKCDLEIPQELYMPDFPIPVTSAAKDLDGYLKELTWQGIEKRYEKLDDEVRERTEYELDVITRMGYSGYFLIVQDFIQAARDQGVRVGPGRGSAAGSLVAYALGITDIDPIQYDLLFERFLNPDRVSMPDIDVDFADDKREKVIEYVKEKYGEDAVSQIITFSTLSSRAVLKDVGRVLGIPHTTINEITKDIQVKFGRVQKLKDAIENAELRWVKESTDPKIKKLIDYSLVLEGFSRAASTHAAGVVIAPGPLEEYIPLYKTPTTGLASQYTMKYLEDAGLLKMDFLGLRTLTIIEDALELIKMRRGIELDIDAIPLDDKTTYEMIGKGLTTAVFQFESPPMQKYLKQLKPERLDDLIAMNALYRPGPMDNIPDFIERRHGRKEIEYLHEKLKPILGTSYGICVGGDTRVIDVVTGQTYRVDELKDVEGIWLQGVNQHLETAFGPVTAFFDNGVRPVVNVRLANGTSVRMTRDHQVLTEEGWKRIGELAAGDYIAQPKRLEFSLPSPYQTTKGFARNSSYGQLPTDYEVNSPFGSFRKEERKNIPTEVVGSLIEKPGMPVSAKNVHVRWERIEAIDDAGEERVYDITVEGIHNFVGNNVILHNCVYQEQIMQIAQQLGGFTLAQADTLRRAMGKKQIQYMEEMKGDYFEGCSAQGIDRKTAGEIWEMMVKFADYGFNKSHSAAYAWVAYQTAFLKANYTPEFLAANMTNEASDQSKVVKLIDECTSFGVQVLPPNINQSMVNFSVDKEGRIVFGMAAIRNVGQSAVQSILDERKKEGPFTSIFDFTKRMSGKSLINKRLLEHLVLAGAFDAIHPNRRQCFEAIDSAIGYGGAWAEQKASGMDSLFSIAGPDGDDATIPEPALPNVEEWNRMEKLKREKEVLDFYVSGHPLEDYELEAQTFSEIRFGELPEELDTTRPTRVCGVVSYVRTKLDRRENQFAIVGIEDFTGKAECIFWSEAWRRNAAMVAEGSMIFVTGRAEIEGADKLRIIADEVTPMSEALQKFTRGIAINVILDEADRETAERAAGVINNHQGDVQCIFRVYDGQGALVGRWGARKATVSPSRQLLQELNDIFGPANVRVAG